MVIADVVIAVFSVQTVAMHGRDDPRRFGVNKLSILPHAAGEHRLVAGLVG